MQENSTACERRSVEGVMEVLTTTNSTDTGTRGVNKGVRWMAMVLDPPYLLSETLIDTAFDGIQ